MSTSDTIASTTTAVHEDPNAATAQPPLSGTTQQTVNPSAGDVNVEDGPHRHGRRFHGEGMPWGGHGRPHHHHHHRHGGHRWHGAVGGFEDRCSDKPRAGDDNDATSPADAAAERRHHHHDHPYHGHHRHGFGHGKRWFKFWADFHNGRFDDSDPTTTTTTDTTSASEHEGKHRWGGGRHHSRSRSRSRSPRHHHDGRFPHPDGFHSRHHHGGVWAMPPPFWGMPMPPHGMMPPMGPHGFGPMAPPTMPPHPHGPFAGHPHPHPFGPHAHHPGPHFGGFGFGGGHPHHHHHAHGPAMMGPHGPHFGFPPHAMEELFRGRRGWRRDAREANEGDKAAEDPTNASPSAEEPFDHHSRRHGGRFRHEPRHHGWGGAERGPRRRSRSRSPRVGRHNGAGAEKPSA